MAYIPSYRDQSWLLPPSIEELIPEDHVCFLIESLIDDMDYGAFDIKYSGAGHPAYHPRVLLKLLIMGVLDRVRSSRRLARHARENVVYMYLSEKLSPDFRTISDFRKDNSELLKEAFKHTVSCAKEEGLLDLSHLATDGSTIKANAANKRIMSKEELAVLLGFVEGELEQWARQDAVEEEQFGQLRGYDQLKEQSRKKVQKAAQHYLKKIKDNGNGNKAEIVGRLSAAQREIETCGLKKVSTTDPESRFMRNKKGKVELSYNPQVTVERNGFVLANNVSRDSFDTEQLMPQVLQTEENIGELPEGVQWSFDAGYYESDNIKFLSDRKIDGYMYCQEKKETTPYDKKNFTYDAAQDEYRCPENERMIFVGTNYDKYKRKTARIYEGQGCLQCLEQKRCTKSRTGRRRLKMFPYESERNAMSAKMRTQEAREIYRIRQQTVEPVFGDIKGNKGIREFLTRGIQTVRTEFNLACTARNIKRIWSVLRDKRGEITLLVKGTGRRASFFRLINASTHFAVMSCR